MASDVVYDAVRAYIDANWTATPVKWENETFEEPAATDYPDPPAAFLVVEIAGDSLAQASIGSGSPAAERWVETGSVLIYSLVQSGAGSRVARANATAMAELLKGLLLPGAIRFERMSIGDGGEGDEDGKWWQILLRANWLRG